VLPWGESGENEGKEGGNKYRKEENDNKIRAVFESV
jgi:hypothetical protein